MDTSQLSDPISKENTGGHFITWAAVLMVFFMFFDIGGMINSYFKTRTETEAQIHRQTSPFAQKPAMQACPRQELGNLALEQYKAASAEIAKRVEYEQTAYLYQFVVLGGVVGFFFFKGWPSTAEDKTGTVASKPIDLSGGSLIQPLGVTLIGLVIVDIHIRYNSLIISELGQWIRESVESPCSPGWELFLSSTAPFHPSTVFAFAAGLLYLPTIILLIPYYVLVFDAARRDNPSFPTLMCPVFILTQACVLIFFLMNTAGGRDEWKNPHDIWNFLVALAFGFLTTIGLRKLRTPASRAPTTN